MTREELKINIRSQLQNIRSSGEALESIMSLIDEYSKPKTKTKTLEERKKIFIEKVAANYELGVGEIFNNFIDYWTEHNEGGKKMRFEMSKNQPFNIKRRLATWKKNQKNYGTTTTKTTGTTDKGLSDWINS